MIICNETECTGCLACIDACPKNAICIRENKQGFRYPSVDSSLCVSCYRCRKVCPVLNQKKNEKSKEVFACWNKDEESRISATSGGVFLELANYIIDSSGVVYGAAFDEELQLKHISVESKDEARKLSGSKYLQSNTEGVYKKVRADLNQEKNVLFSGTPCQCSALKAFLGKEYPNLFIVDIICHGVPSPGVFKDYLEYINTITGNKQIERINFRYKEPGWSVFSMKINYKNGYAYQASKFKDPWLNFFSGGGDLTLRDSCFECKFTSPERVGDLTLADFWGIQARKPSQRDIEKGVNLVLINSEKGKMLFNNIKQSLIVDKRSWRQAYASNKSLVQPWKKPDIYNVFWRDYSILSFDKMVEKYCIYDSDEEKKKCDEATWRAQAYRHLFFYIKRLGRAVKSKLRR